MNILNKVYNRVKLAKEFSQQIRIIMSKEPIKILSNLTSQKSSNMKPKGLWYGFGGSWIDWMSSEMPEWINAYNYIYTLDVDDLNIVKVTSNNVDRFSEKYEDFNKFYINWEKVSKDYKGFEAPPPYNKHSDKLWWGTLDVASGCIWDTSCIKDIKLLGKQEKGKWILKGEEEEVTTNDLAGQINYEEFERNILGYEEDPE